MKKNDTVGRSFNQHPIQDCSEKRQEDLIIKINDSTNVSTNGDKTSLSMVGFIVEVKDPQSKVTFQELGQSVEVLPIGNTRILNYTYKGTGDVYSRFTVLDKGVDHWDIKQFKIKIIKDNSTPGDLITNFYKTKVVGMIADGSVGLDVAFLISSGRTLKYIQWIFGDESPPKSIQKPSSQDLQYATHHTYKNDKKEYDGSVTVWDHQNKQQQTKYFKIIMAEI